MARLVSWVRCHPRAVLVIATLACLLPFADKAFHIDDPLFVWAGRQMQRRLWDPFGFNVNWYGWSMPMHEVTKNPPLACAGIALILSLFGESEFALHCVFFLPAYWQTGFPVAELPQTDPSARPVHSDFAWRDRMIPGMVLHCPTKL